MAAGPELCPHCRRPFKRLRAHLPHCKAAPRPPPPPGSPPPPGTSPRPAPASAPGPGSAPAASPQPSPAAGCVPGPTPAPGPGPSPGTARGPGAAAAGSGSGPGQPREAAAAGGSEGSAKPAVQDVARSLDLHPEEVEDVPGKLEKGLKVVIRKHRARVLREKEPGSGAGAAGGRGAPGQGTDPGPAPPPQRPKTAPKSKRKETRSQGAVGNGAGSSKGEKSRLKATKNLHLSLTEAFGAHGRGTSKNELSSLPGPRDSGERMDGVSEPILSLGRDPGLALLHAPKIQPTCSCQASGRSTRAGARGLEWFPDLYPDYEGLRIFPGKRFREDVRITVETPRGGFSQGQQGPLSERPLMEVRLGELHTWISTCNFSPQGLLGAVQKAWSSYCAKYIHVRQGGPAGISMLLAGYCLLSYGWNYQHLKQHRWRKYH
uniref:ATP synthase membrane subunit f n=1 Tax=Corvus moneduloides TaxID=1196302 RepID=A0A8C3EQJ9_CORMO